MVAPSRLSLTKALSAAARGDHGPDRISMLHTAGRLPDTTRSDAIGFRIILSLSD